MRHVFVGLVVCCLGIWGMIAWWNVFGVVMRGVIPFFCVVFGLIAILSGLQRMPEEEHDSDSELWGAEEEYPASDFSPAD